MFCLFRAFLVENGTKTAFIKQVQGRCNYVIPTELYNLSLFLNFSRFDLCCTYNIMSNNTLVVICRLGVHSGSHTWRLWSC